MNRLTLHRDPLGGQVEWGGEERIEAERLVRRLAQRACQIPLVLVFLVPRVPEWKRSET